MGVIRKIWNLFFLR